MEWIQIHPHGNPKNGELESAIAARPSDTPYVNRDGLRFVDETGRRDEISYGILKQPGQVAFSIYDQRSIDEGKVEEKKIAAAIAHGYAFKADTLEGLARQAGIDWRNFEKTMKAYNEASVSQNAKALPVPKILIGNPVVKAPFYAVPITTTIHHTMGGLRINEKTQVLDKNGNVIPGLYAAGEITAASTAATASAAMRSPTCWSSGTSQVRKSPKTIKKGRAPSRTAVPPSPLGGGLKMTKAPAAFGGSPAPFGAVRTRRRR